MAKKNPGTYVAGQGTGPLVAAAITQKAKQGGSADDEQTFGELLVERRHQDWREHQINWRFLLDSLEGGERYRNATYGPDRRGFPIRNLVRHKREYPDPQANPQTYQGFAAGFLGNASSTAGPDVGYGPYPGMLGADPGAVAADDDYELRRARTPIPEFVAEAVEIWRGKIYDQDVARDGPDELIEWWKNVDGCGTDIDDYMREVICPLLLTLGLIDVCIDHPAPPRGEKVETRADTERLGLDAAVASYILPENMVWWRNDNAGRYAECLIREYVDPSDRIDFDEEGNQIDTEAQTSVAQAWRRDYLRWRHWTATSWTLYNHDGKEILESADHPYGRVPIIRLIDQKKLRTRNVGKSRCEAIALYQREFYNRDSELILSDTLQAHPFLCVPEDYLKADNTLSCGPGYLFPMKKHADTGTYTAPEYISPSKDPADSLRKNKQDILDMKDRRACLTKPAGVTGTSGGTVGQSGVSKQLDAVSGNKLLGDIARSLAKTERFLAEYAWMVIKNQVPPPDIQESIEVGYPTKFELFSADEIANGTILFQQVCASAGEAPNTERELAQAIYRQLLPGLDDDAYRVMDEELETLMETKSQLKEQMRELTSDAMSQSNTLAGDGADEQKAGSDPSGESSATLVSNFSPVVN